MKLKVGDNVIVIAGKNKGKTGKITKIIHDKDLVVVDKVNFQIKHQKKTANDPGKKTEKEAPLHASNVMILCPKTNKKTRIGYHLLKNNKKERFAKVSNEPLP